MSTTSRNGIWSVAVIAALAVAASWTAQGVGIAVHADSDGGGSISKVHGSINVPASGKAGAVKTVNGSVTIGDGAEVESVKVVNGSVRLREGATVLDRVKSVNGSIELAANARVQGNASTVNGRVELSPGSVVDGEASTVNGRLELRGAEVGALTTTNGDIELADGAVVHGDLTVHKPSNEGWSLFGKDRPRVVIGENCQVRGTLHFEQEVELVVADSASIGEITGVEPARP